VSTFLDRIYYNYDNYAGSGAPEAILSRPNEYRHLVALKAVVPLRGALQLSTTLVASIKISGTS